ncbi:hypothetical protein Vretimale_203 [Volvox reticuliferus]|uniref:tRNA (guanine(10)-N(2))-methyltransferase TRMT11 N-terminal domain-containing protein n=1 Tax=Volvox reticuliferus TaxID=1737510 RepID=A0A8J4G2C4_9CHLO|nr:hypothetical protein Vretimale_203 [Volvox reticuliferus]
MVRVVPNAGVDDRADDAPSTSGKEYLTYFVHRLLEFRRPELESIAQTAGCKDEQLQWRAPAGDVDHSPFWYLTLPSEDAAVQISKRMILTKMLVEVWAEGENWDELRAAFEAFPGDRKSAWLRPDLTFRVVVESFGSSLPMDEQLELIERLEFIPFKRLYVFPPGFPAPIPCRAPYGSFPLYDVTHNTRAPYGYATPRHGWPLMVGGCSR